MSFTMETTKGDTLYQSNQCICPDTSSEGVCQAKHDNSCCGTHHIKKVISERFIEEERFMSSSPTPNKHPRVDREAGDNDHDNEEMEHDGMESAGLAIDTSDDIVHIKSEPPDDMDKVQTKNESISFLHTLSRARSNSLHSTTKSCTRTGDVDTSKLHSISSPPTSTGPGGERPRSYSVSLKRPSTSLVTTKACDSLHDQPDSSTGTCEQLIRGSGRHHPVSSLTLADDESSAHQPATTSSTSSGEAVLCQVCGDLAAGFYCDAFICEACKKFFIRASKLERPRYVCLRHKDCIITKESRVHCQYCRYQKCLQLNMHYSKDGHKSTTKVGIQEIPCRVCSAPSSGFHFGALTCEGCKGFFRRMVKEREAYSYKCSRNSKCDVNAMTRNMCKACRYNKCLRIGMSVEGSRIGRQPNAVKHAISLEAMKQAALKTETESSNRENSSPSSFNFDSVILDHCMPGEVEDSFHSGDSNQDSASVCALTSQSMKTEEISSEQESSLSSCQDSCMSAEVRQHISSPTPQQDTDVFRIPHQTLPHYGIPKDLYSASMSSSSMSFSTPRNIHAETLGRPYAETLSSSMDNQPQDLSIDLSIHRSNTSNSIHITSHSTQPPCRPNNLSSPLIYPPMLALSHEDAHIRSSPKHNPPSTPNYNPADYIPQTQQTFHRSYIQSSSVDQEEHHMSAYQHGVSYDTSSPVFNIGPYNQYTDHNIAQDIRHIPQRETFFNSSSTSQPAGHFTSPNLDYNRQQALIEEHHQVYHYHQHGHEVLQQPQPLHSRGDSREDLCAHHTDQQLYVSHLDQREVYNDPCSHHNFPEPSCQVCDSSQQQNFKLSSQQWSRCPSDILPQSPSDVISHFQHPSPAVTPTPCTRKEVRPTPASTPNFDMMNAPSPAPILEKVAVARDQNYMSMPNKEMHIVLLDAAKNLAHFCVVHRAKSDRFDIDRFKDVDSIWDKMMEHFNFHAKCIVRFAKRVPGFRILKIDDQVLLLRMATYSLVILNHSRTFEPDTGFYNYFNFTQKEIERIRELFPEFDVIHSHYKRTGLMTQRLGLTEMEFAYMSCMLLLNDEYPGLEDIERTKELKERYMDAFQDYELEHFSNGSLRFAQMLLRLSEFSQINMEHNIAVGLVITKNSQLHIPQLYAEMYAPTNLLENSDSTK